jgi:hypothetical protein
MNLAQISGALILTLVAALPSRAKNPFDPKPVDGHVTLTFTQRSDLTTNQEIVRRMGWDLAAEAAAKIDYTLSEESFEVYIPADYTGDKPFGLFVFVSPGPSGKPARHFLQSFDDHHLIYISPNKVGNDRVVRPRMGLAIDAALSAQAKFKIDPQRVYVSGVSGGGRVASLCAMGYPDVFTGGGLYMIGCDFYHDEPCPEQKGRFFAKTYRVPPPNLLKLAKKQSKHVFLTGDTDGNREQTHCYYDCFKRDGFEHITYLQVPGMGHQAPDAEWFEKGIAALDEPLPQPAAAVAKPKIVITTRPAAAPASTQPADPRKVADQLLINAKLYIDNHVYDRAREKLRWIVEKFPDTPAAADAKKLLAEITGK